jgi:transketolase
MSSSEMNKVGHQPMANAVRALSMDAVQKANSGHPGMPMGMADVATVLFTQFLKFDPADPQWPDRDRFVLSAGHGSMLLYSLLYLTGYEDATIEQLRDFRQLGSKTAGHPEYGELAGIETTTGPLGQGIANAVGMALAERILATKFGSDHVDHFTYAIAGDGCLMEGISHEAISLAGHLKLSKLIVLFDDNQITIDGPTSLSVSDDQHLRFKASGWDVTSVDGHDPEAIADALAAAQKTDKPTMIACRTEIGHGAPTKAGTAGSHGSPLGDEEIAGARDALNWPHAPFEIPDEIAAAWRAAGARGSDESQAWNARMGAADEAEKQLMTDAFAGNLPPDFADVMKNHIAELVEAKPNLATRQSSGKTLDLIDAAVPNLLGGSADLTGSNNTKAAGQQPITPDDFSGRYMYWGVREHGMAAAMNGVALHGGVIPYSGAFMVFSDYCRPSMRLSALMGQRVIYVMTHDSIGLGEDGPTHQPVEHLAALRAIPNLLVFRPADAVEVAEAWQCALETADKPSVMTLTRQAVPAVRLSDAGENLVAKGGYELIAAEGEAQATLLASGSEIGIAVQARNLLQSAGIPTRVVSMPCWELFEEQDDAYQQSVLQPNTVRVAVEAAISMGWERYTGDNGGFVGMTGFGASAPAKDLYNHFGITAEAVVDAVRKKL